MKVIMVFVMGLAISGCSIVHTAIGSLLGNIGADIVKDKQLFSDKGDKPKDED